MAIVRPLHLLHARPLHVRPHRQVEPGVLAKRRLEQPLFNLGMTKQLPVASARASAGSLLLPQFSLCTVVQSGKTVRNLLNSTESTSPRRLARPRTSPFHGGNTGSNPVGDANIPKHFRDPAVFAHGPIWSSYRKSVSQVGRYAASFTARSALLRTKVSRYLD